MRFDNIRKRDEDQVLAREEGSWETTKVRQLMWPEVAPTAVTYTYGQRFRINLIAS